LTFSESAAVEYETFWTASENRPNLRNQPKRNKNISIKKKTLLFLEKKKVHQKHFEEWKTGGGAWRVPGPLLPIRAISQVELRSTQSIRLCQSINQSINQSMVNDEDNERVTARRR